MPDPDLLLRQPWIAAARALTGDQRRVADALIDLLEATPALQMLGPDGLAYAVTGAVHASQARLAELAGVSRKVVRAALERLHAAGAIDMGADEGPHGGVIALIGAAWVRPWIAGIGPVRKFGGPYPLHAGPVVSALVERMCSEIPTASAEQGPVKGPVFSVDRGPVIPPATDRADSRFQDRTGAKGPVFSVDRGPVISRSIEPSTTGYPQAPSTEIAAGSPSEAAALHDRVDLLLTVRQTTDDSDPSSTPTAAADPDHGPHQPDPKMQLRGPEPKAKVPRARKRPAVTELPPRALEMADLVRHHCLTAQSWHQVRKCEPWETHPTRAKWARELDALVKLHADGPLDEPRVYALIARMVAWVGSDQGTSDPKYRIIVLGVSSLREKWDRIAARVAPIAPAHPSEPRPVHASSQRKLAFAP